MSCGCSSSSLREMREMRERGGARSAGGGGRAPKAPGPGRGNEGGGRRSAEEFVRMSALALVCEALAQGLAARAAAGRMRSVHRP